MFCVCVLFDYVGLKHFNPYKQMMLLLMLSLTVVSMMSFTMLLTMSRIPLTMLMLNGLYNPVFVSRFLQSRQPIHVCRTHEQGHRCWVSQVMPISIQTS